MRPRRLKLGTHVDSGQMYCIFQNQAAAAYLSLYFFFFLSLQFSNIEIFSSHLSLELWDLEGWNLLHMWNMYHLYRNHAAALICPFIFLSLQFSNIKRFSSHFSQELWCLEDWNLVHMWTVGRCIVCTRIRLLHVHSFISSFFSFSPIF